MFLLDKVDRELYSASAVDGKTRVLSSDVGIPIALAVDAKHIAVSSGKKIVFFSRADGKREKPPIDTKALTGGSIAGLAIDAAGGLWFIDLDKHVVKGPVSIN